MNQYKDHPPGRVGAAIAKVKDVGGMLMDKKSRQPTLFGWLFLIMLIFLLMSVYRHGQAASSLSERANSLGQRPGAGRYMKVNPPAADVLTRPVVRDPQESEFKAVLEHNARGGGAIKMPEFDPNQHLDMQEHDPDKAKHMEQFGRPQPKEFPVEVLAEPRLSCPGRRVQLVVLVMSRPDGTGERAAIRRTWGRQTKDRFPDMKGDRWRTIFVMGMTETRFDQMVQQENHQHGDILQGALKESPFEGTRKVALALKWLSEHTSSCTPQFVLKTNDNIFHNMQPITDWLDARFPEAQGLYAGKLLRRDHPVRKPADPYYVSESDFRPEVFPDLIQGPEYLLSMDAVVRLDKARRSVTPIAIEDAFVGLLAQSAGVMPRHNDHFQMMKRPRSICHMLTLFFVFNVYPYEHMELFKKLAEAKQNGACAGAETIDIARRGVSGRLQINL